MMSVEVVRGNVGTLQVCFEGPHWDDVTKTIVYVDYLGGIHRYNPVTKQAEKIVMDGTVGIAVPTRSGKLAVSSGHRIGMVDWETGSFEVIHEVEGGRKTDFNDGKCDAKGRLWTGTTSDIDESTWPTWSQGRDGGLYCLHPDKKLVTHLQEVGMSNGTAWSLDDKTMYYIDSLSSGVDAFDYDVDTGNISRRRQIIKVPSSEGLPDGMCIDSEGMLWVALFGRAAISRYNPNTGEKLRTITFPTDNITNCCWGGENYDELYVTSATYLLSKEQLKDQPTAGSLFRVTGLGVRGVKSLVFDDSKFSLCSK